MLLHSSSSQFHKISTSLDTSYVIMTKNKNKNLIYWPFIATLNNFPSPVSLLANVNWCRSALLERIC